MKTTTLSAGLLALALVTSCDNGVISGPTTADIIARVTPWRGQFDSVIVDIRVGSFRGPLRESWKLTDPDQSQFAMEDLPVGEWVLAAVYFKTHKDTTVIPHRITTAHRVSVAQGTVAVVYDGECQCNFVEGDNVDLRLKN